MRSPRAHGDGEHVDPEHVVLQADERGQAVQRHAALTVVPDVEAGGEQLGAHVVVVGQQVEAAVVVATWVRR